MRKIRDVLTCSFEKNLSDRETACYTGVNRGTVADYRKRFRRSGLHWPLPVDMDGATLELALYPTKFVIKRPVDRLVDYPEVHIALRQKGATLATLHQEWLDVTPTEDHVSYSQFCRAYTAFKKSLQLSMRQAVVYGEAAFVDYSGATLGVTDPKSGVIQKVQIFIGVLGGSSYTFCEATWTQRSRDWIASHARMFEFFGGVPRIVVPDNLKAAVIKADRFSPVINESYNAMCRYYGTHPFPARPRQPRDKAKAEAGVLLAQRWILFTLRRRKFFSLMEMNQEIGTLLEKLNNRPFQKLAGSRFSKWLESERPTLLPLPAERYEFADWGKVRAGQDYYVHIDHHFYSVPFQLKGQKFEYCLSANSVDLLFKGKCIVTHTRSFASGLMTTVDAHRHPSHKAVSQWAESEALQWAAGVGPNTVKLLKIQLTKIKGYLTGYRITQGMKTMVKSYGNVRFEEASTYAVLNKITGSPALRNILSKKLDLLFGQEPITDAKADIAHENIRGADYYNQIFETTKEKE